MSQPPPPLPPSSLPLTTTSSRPAPVMTETQKLPVFSPPGFNEFAHRRLPPLEIPPDAVPPRPDHHFRSPINQLPSIHAGLPPRHDYHHPPPVHRSAAPVDKLLHHSNSYTPPRSDPPYSPQQYGPPISPRSEFDSRGPRRLTEHRYPYEEHRHFQHQQHQQQHQHQHQEHAFSSLTSPIEAPHQRLYAPLPSPAYTPSYASSSTPFRGSVGSLQHAQSHRGSIGAPLGTVAYPEPSTVAPPPRKQPRPIPLPGSIPQPVYNEQL